MIWLWILLAAVVLLLLWAGWRQKRYGGTTHYDSRDYHPDVPESPNYGKQIPRGHKPGEGNSTS